MEGIVGSPTTSYKGARHCGIRTVGRPWGFLRAVECRRLDFSTTAPPARSLPMSSMPRTPAKPGAAGKWHQENTNYAVAEACRMVLMMG